MNTNAPMTAHGDEKMTRAEQLAAAYEAIAGVNHYMVGLVEKVTADERDDAEQALITRQNQQVEGSELWTVLELALDLLEHDRRAFR